MASEQGGMNIEVVAKENPSALIWQPIDIVQGNIFKVVNITVSTLTDGMGWWYCHIALLIWY